MDELKSAWEIAQERVNRLGKLSTGEREEQEKQRYRQIGQALAQKWLDSSRHVDMGAELNKHGEKGREMIKQALIGHLTEAIAFTNVQSIDTTKRLIEAISSVQPELRPQAEEMAGLLHEYEEAEQKLRQELEGDYRETLHRLRISGTAVGAINLEASDKWQLARNELLEVFTPALDDLKRALVR